MLEQKQQSMNNKVKEEIKEKEETSKDTKENANVPTASKVSSTSSDKPKVKEKQELVPLTKSELETLDYTDFSTPARMRALAEVLCKSSLSPLKKSEDVVMALMTGKELGLPFVTSLSQIYPINNRPTLGVHIQKAILLKNGVIFEKVEDAVTIYNFLKKNKDGTAPETTTVKDDKGRTREIPVIVSNGTIEEQPSNTFKAPIDTRTTYKFTRELKQPSGKFKEISAKGSFTISEATDAELITKDVWKKYWRRMLDARAFTNGAREIADDLLLGIYSPSELSTDFYVTESGEEVHNATIVAND